MKRRTIISAATLIAISGCTSRQNQTNTTDEQANKTNTTSPQETSSLNVVSVSDSPQIPEEYQGKFRSSGETVIIEIPDSDQIYMSSELSLPNPNYVFKRDVTVSNGNTVVIDYSAEDNSPSNVAAPSVIQPTIDTVGIEVSDLQPNTTVEIKTISNNTITHNVTERESISRY